jgi:hypothetical protein
MQSVIEGWCNLIGVSDQFAIQVAVGAVAGGGPLIVIYGLLRVIGETASSDRLRISH